MKTSSLKIFVKKLFNDKGLWGTLLLSVIILCFFYGNILKNPNQVFFSKDGDGLQSYYTTIYHIKYDSTYSHFQGMNYPYGEHVLFTNCQLPISNTVKFISNNLIDISGYAVGIINLFMLLSIVIAAVFLYLIFKEFGVNQYYSTFVAVGIAYLSPLINRFPGHFSLSYVFVIPIILYLVIRFFKKPSWKLSIVMGVFILLMTTFHMYNYAFSFLIIATFWIIQLFSDKKYRKWKFALLNIVLQIVLPILIINIWLHLTNTVTDRTSHPGGFLNFRSAWEGIFIQDQNITSPFLKSFIHTRSLEWEGWAYIGHVASYIFIFLFTIWSCIPFYSKDNFGFFLIILLLGIIIHSLLKRHRNYFQITKNKLPDIFLWTGFLSILVSYAIPFSIYPKLLPYAGFLCQFRGIGRFAWIFFYTINIGVFYYIFNLKINFRILKFLVLGASIFVLYFDAYTNNKNMPNWLNNSIPELSNTGNKLIGNLWTLKIVPDKYQAIIPLPYFHSGSENIGNGPKCNIALYSFIVSLKTGLPMNAVMMSRTSLSQSFENISVMSEPYRKRDALIFKKSQKPFLLLVSECDDLSKFEKLMIQRSSHLYDAKGFSFYELKAETLRTFTDSLYDKAFKEFEIEKKFINDSVFSNDSIRRYEYKRYENLTNKGSYLSNGCYTGIMTDYNTLFEGNISNAIPDTNYVISFWFGKVHKDVFPRTTIEVAYYDSAGTLYNSEYYSTMSCFKIFDNDWGLVELKARFKKRNDKMKVTLWNEELSRKDTMYVDDFLIRPDFVNIYTEEKGNYVMKNNRYYLLTH